ncbi:hypothetical protein AGDE_01182 [Angomonas deanei]|nr:hypothetical protein AGDE_01182 [Angomonas deanei]|eukprot:EPY42741.1 hypothetical protein AGDE_01182 [Angomonas deanei]
MGGDGQALGNKKRLLESEKQYSTEADSAGVKKNVQLGRWKNCFLSLKPLEVPMAFDLNGNIFSKKSVLEYLLDTKEGRADPIESETFKVKRLSDICEIVGAEVDLVCPISGVTFSPERDFVGLWPCGHVISENEMKGNYETKHVCPLCEEEVVVVKLNTTEECSISQKKIFIPSAEEKEA